VGIVRRRLGVGGICLHGSIVLAVMLHAVVNATDALHFIRDVSVMKAEGRVRLWKQ